jgi:2-polyprenyl-6-methoxyphenol hydroxylase-like FAD-dependent oxidoreductase
MTTNAAVAAQKQAVPDTQTTSCCVVGGGPAGAMLSLLLARRGVHVTLLEMHKDFDRDFRGDTVHPSILEVLDQIGLAEKVHEIPHAKITGPTFQFADGPFRPFNLERLKTRFPYILMIPQSRFKLVMHAQVQHLIEKNGAIAGVRYLGGDGQEHELRATLTIGADGRFSTVRRLAGFDPVKTAPPMDVLWFRLPKLPGEPEVTGGAFGGIGGGRIFVLLERNDHWQAGLVFPKGQYQTLRTQGVQAIRKSLAETEPHFARHAESLTDWSQFTLLSVESSRCPLWHKPGVLVIGDAAHVMSPVGGVGINYAVQDAVVAANVLAGPLKSGTISEAHLAQVQRQRQWPTRVIQGMQSMMQDRLMTRALQSTRPATVPWQMKLLLKIPFLRDIPSRLIAFGPRRVRLE